MERVRRECRLPDDVEFSLHFQCKVLKSFSRHLIACKYKDFLWNSGSIA